MRLKNHMSGITVTAFCSLALALSFPVAALAQARDGDIVSAPQEPDAIRLGSGAAEGATAPEIWFRNGGMLTVRNVRQATLTPFLPDPVKATGAAVIVAPGGGFLMLSMESEGWLVARWLADHGIAAFVLKYRLKPTEADVPAFQQQLTALFRGAMRPDARVGEPTPDYAVEDGRAALALVRTRAAAWHVDPHRVGMVGFSAGAMTILGVTLSAQPEAMPAFIAPIYGSLAAVDVPAAAPPMFAAMANDDPLFGRKGFGLIESWQKARRPVEFHLYQRGSHGFGMGARGTTSTGWIDAFYRWLEMNNFLKAGAK